jgi:hypothetical protein
MKDSDEQPVEVELRSLKGRLVDEPVSLMPTGLKLTTFRGSASPDRETLF